MIPGTAVIAEAMAIEAVGAAVQGSLGFGINLVAAPLLELVDPRFVPAPLILAGLVSGLLVSARERGGATDQRGLWWGMAGRVPGTVLGAGVVLLVPSVTLEVIVAVVVIVAVLSSLAGMRLRRTRSSLFGTGVASGVMGTVAGLGGTPMALVYQDETGPAVRATLARYAALGAVISLVALALVGKIGSAQLLLAAVLLPGVFAGFLLSDRLRSVLDHGGLRPAILGVIGLASVAVLVQAGLR